ncbi:MAG: M2 family metallopeptidase [Candidatus Sumerlaeia bacterium]
MGNVDQKARAFINEQTQVMRPLEKSIALAYWDASLSGKPEDFEKAAQLEKQMVEHYSDPEAYEKVEALQENKDAIADPKEARQIDILYRNFKGSQGDPELQKKIVDLESDLTREFNTFRADYHGDKKSNNDLRDILKHTSDSEEARDAWEALKQVGSVAAPRVLQLIRLRNQHARSLGSPNYYTFSLELQELDQTALFDLLAELEEKSNPLFKELKTRLDQQLASEFGIAQADLRPWHYRNPFFQEMPANEEVDLDPVFSGKNLENLTQEYYRGIGLDIDPILKTSDLYEKEGKDQHAFCIAVDAPRDVRVLCNLRSNENWMSTMLHEFGHAVYDRYLDPSLPFFLRGPAHTLSTEAIAMLNERFLYRAEFLHKIAGMPENDALRTERLSRRHKRDTMLVFLRWVLVMAHFERGLYENPDADHSARWWEIVERFQWLDGSSRKTFPDWASKMHLACAPVYYQNYLMGEMNASQFMAAMQDETEGRIVGNPKAGAFLQKRVFAPGATMPWFDLVRHATGETLKTDYYLNDLNHD